MKSDPPLLIIAIDGHSSCGKSTFAKRIAQMLKYSYVDTGAMYRAVTLYFINAGLFRDTEEPAAEQIKSMLHKVVVELKYNEESGQTETFL